MVRKREGRERQVERVREKKKTLAIKKVQFKHRLLESHLCSANTLLQLQANCLSAFFSHPNSKIDIKKSVKEKNSHIKVKNIQLNNTWV